MKNLDTLDKMFFVAVFTIITLLAGCMYEMQFSQHFKTTIKFEKKEKGIKADTLNHGNKNKNK